MVALPLHDMLSQIGVFALFAASLVSHSARASPLPQLAIIPDYVITYAPLSYLYSKEQYFHSDVAIHLEHTTPQINYTSIGNATITSLASVSADAFLTSDDNVEKNPAWLLSTGNKPDATGYSAAPGTIVCVQKEGGIVDAFYFSFYSYNYGPQVLGLRFGNHVGDWEHIAIRFVDGAPAYIWLSTHDWGEAYNFTALEKRGLRPVTYIATGTHANYATAGTHDFLLPLGLLSDRTDAGQIWDITKNYRGFWYDVSSQSFSGAGGVGIGGTKQMSEGTSWLTWTGRWGDQQYPISDPRQLCILEQCHYVTGPTGPVVKNLSRVTICQYDECEILEDLSRQESALNEQIPERSNGLMDWVKTKGGDFSGSF